MKWKSKEIGQEHVRSITERYNIKPLAAAIAARRGKTDDLMYFIEDDLKYLHNPFLFTEMEDAVERIVQAVEEGEKVMIYGDRDVDGISAVTLLYSVLKELNCRVSWDIPRGDDTYGLSRKDIEKFKDGGHTLLITVDCGISNRDEIELAGEYGIDVIITDHHLPPEELPSAWAILNPKLEDSGYPFEHLAGCAVVSKLVWALRFASSPLYKRSVTLLNIVPENETFRIEAVLMTNLVETDRVIDHIIPGITSLQSTRLEPFLTDHEIFVFNSKQQTGMLRKIFGGNVEIHLIDLADNLYDLHPNINGWSLLKIFERSRFSRYGETPSSEIDMLKQIFTSICFSKNSSLEKEYANSLELVALGTIADLMPLKDENLILVKRGLAAMQETGRPGLRRLLEQQDLMVKKLTPVDIGWYVSPLLNAAGRLGQPEVSAELLMTGSMEKAAGLYKQVAELNNRRKKIGEEIWELIQKEAQTSFEEHGRKCVLVSRDEMPRGITGIIASRLSKYFRVPAIVLAPVGDIFIGSIRCQKGFHAKEFLGHFEKLFNDFGGHECAGGFNLPKTNYVLFQEKLSEEVIKIETEETDETYEIDAEISPEHMTPALIEIVDFFEPYGEGNPQLLFLARQCKILDINLVGKSRLQHVKMLLEIGANKWPAVFWNSSDRVGRDITVNAYVDCLFRLGRNFFQNRENLQLTVVDLMPAVG